MYTAGSGSAKNSGRFGSFHTCNAAISEGQRPTSHLAARAYSCGSPGTALCSELPEDHAGAHPYMAVGNLSPDAPDTDGIWRMRHIPTLRSAMLAVGDDKPIWFTEFGWRAGSVGTANWQLAVSSTTQAQYVAKTLSIITNEWPYVTRVYWYRELGSSNDTETAGYGLVLPNGTAQPALSQVPAIYAAS